ncbi:MAG: hypothetical protein ACOCXG_04500 [Nanoarchaeota archaeon]
MARYRKKNSFLDVVWKSMVVLIAMVCVAMFWHGINYYVFQSWVLPAWIYLIVGLLGLTFLSLLGLYKWRLRG